MRLFNPVWLAIAFPILISQFHISGALADWTGSSRGNSSPPRTRHVAAPSSSQSASQESSVLRPSSASLKPMNYSHNAKSTAAYKLDPRQTQEVVNVASDCIVPSKAWVPEAYCASYADLTSATEVCRTLWTSTTACNVNTAPSTFSASGPTMTVECIKGQSCGGGACSASTVEAVDDCTGCSTSDGFVFISQATAFPSGTTPPSFTGPLSPLSSDETAPAPASTPALGKRTMPGISNYPSYDAFMVAQCAATELLVPLREDPDGTSSALLRSFRNRPFTMAVAGLRGCTSMVVVSRRGVWMAHFWEDPTFFSESGETGFEKDVLHGIFTGDNSGQFPGIPGDLFFAEETGDLAPISAKVFIVTPTVPDHQWQGPVVERAPPGAENWKFLPDLMRLINVLEPAFGPPEVVTYQLLIAPSNLDPPQQMEWRAQQMESKANGRVVLQYDPLQFIRQQPITDNSGQVTGTCSTPYAMWKLYVDERGLVGSDTWAATQEQLQGANVYNAGTGQLRRDGEQKVIDWSQPVCIRANSTSTTSSTTTATPPPSAICKLHLVEEIFDNVKNDSQTGQMQAQYELIDWRGVLQHNGSWLPQHNMTDNYTVMDAGNTSKTIFVANFAEQNGSLVSAEGFDPASVLDYGIAVQVITNAGMLSWNIDTDMDNSQMPNCSIGEWTGSQIPTDITADHPVRNMDCYYPCSGIVPNSTAVAASIIASILGGITPSPAPTTTATAPISTGTCTVHVTERVYSDSYRDGDVQPTIELYLTDGSLSISENFGMNPFANAYIVEDGDGTPVIRATFQDSPSDGSLATIDASQWAEYTIQIGLMTPNGSFSVFSNQTDNSSIPYCNVGPWTTQDITPGLDPPTRDLDCYFDCLSNFDPPTPSPSGTTTTAVEVVPPAPTVSTPTTTSSFVAPNPTQAPPEGTCRVHVTQFVASTEDFDGSVSAAISYYDAAGSNNAFVDFHAASGPGSDGESHFNGFDHEWSILDINNDLLVTVVFQSAAVGVSSVYTMWSELTANVTLYLETGKETALTTETDSSRTPYCNVGGWTSDRVRDMDCYFSCPYE